MANTATTAATIMDPPCKAATAFGSNYFYALSAAGTTAMAKRKVPESSVLSNKENNSLQQQEVDSSEWIRKTTRLDWDIPPWTQEAQQRQRKAQRQQQRGGNGSGHVRKASLMEDSEGIGQAVATAQSTVFLTQAGKVYQTGTLHGQVYASPTAITIPLPIPCVELAAGRHFCLGRMQGGIAVCSWGAGHFGQLGIGPSGGSSGDSQQQQPITFTSRPILIERLLPSAIGSTVVQIAAGDWHGMALTESGMVWAWGSNRSQQCGRKHKSSSGPSDETPTLVIPTPVPLDVEMRQICAGRSHSLALSKASHQVYSWGSSVHGQCGHAVRRSPQPPRLVEGMRDLQMAKVAAAGNHSLALTAGGRLFAWGQQTEGQLGLGPAYLAQAKPRLVSELDFVAIVAGREWRATAAAAQQQPSPLSPKEDAAAAATQAVDAAAGTETAGGTFESPLKSIPRIVNVFAGPSYTVALSSSGHAYCFGSNDAGQLGVPTPTQLPLRDNSNAAAAGSSSRSSANTTTSSSSSNKDVHVQTFDSRHNVLLPTRVNALVETLRIRTVACGPNHVWYIGDELSPNQMPAAVGRTLHEVQADSNSNSTTTTAIPLALPETSLLPMMEPTTTTTDSRVGLAKEDPPEHSFLATDSKEDPPEQQQQQLLSAASLVSVGSDASTSMVEPSQSMDTVGSSSIAEVTPSPFLETIDGGTTFDTGGGGGSNHQRSSSSSLRFFGAGHRVSASAPTSPLTQRDMTPPAVGVSPRTGPRAVLGRLSSKLRRRLGGRSNSQQQQQSSDNNSLPPSSSMVEDTSTSAQQQPLGGRRSSHRRVKRNSL